MEAMTKAFSAVSNSPVPVGAVAEYEAVSTPSRMVAVAVMPPLTKNDIRQMSWTGKKYNPRLHKSAGREEWREELTELTRKSQIPTSMLTAASPTFEVIKDRHPTYNSQELERELQNQLAIYQYYNTALWDIARDSLDFAGPFEKSDQQYFRDNFMIGELRDGYRCFTTAYLMGDEKDVNSQVKAS